MNGDVIDSCPNCHKYDDYCECEPGFKLHKVDPIKRPAHYCDGIETIDYIHSKLTEEQFYGYCIGNVLKYISRAGKKGDKIEDLKKAEVYLSWAEKGSPCRG